MNNNEFSNFEVEVQKFSDTDFFNCLTYVDHLTECIRYRDEGNKVKFSAHANKVLQWSITRNCIKHAVDTMYDYYGIKALKVVYESISREDMTAELQLAVYDCLLHSFSFEKFFYEPGADIFDTKAVTAYYAHWMIFYLKKVFRKSMLEYAKTFYPQIDETQIIKYVKMRRMSGYTVDLDDPDDVIAATLGVTERSVEHLRIAFAEFDDYYLLSDTVSTTAADPERVVIAQHDQKMSARQAGKLTEIMRSMPEKDRRILIGVYVNGQTVREIAEELGISKSSVSYTANKVIKELKTELATMATM